MKAYGGLSLSLTSGGQCCSGRTSGSMRSRHSEKVPLSYCGHNFKKLTQTYGFTQQGPGEVGTVHSRRGILYGQCRILHDQRRILLAETQLPPSTKTTTSINAAECMLVIAAALGLHHDRIRNTKFHFTVGCIPVITLYIMLIR
jgi:hypothetical protein